MGWRNGVEDKIHLPRVDTSFILRASHWRFIYLFRSPGLPGDPGYQATVTI